MYFYLITRIRELGGMVPSNQELYRSSLGRDEIRLLSADFRVKLVLARPEFLTTPVGYR